MDYLHLSISELHNLILKGEVTPEQLVKSALEKAKKDPNNAFEYICEKEALEQLAALTNKDKNSPLYGIPFVLKDNYSTKDIPTCASSNILEGYIPVFDAEIVTRLLNAGAILIGKTTMDELAMGGSGMSGHLGYTYNPFDPSHKHQMGGSSCGSAAAMAAGIVPFAIGSDTGDSVRKPASFGAMVGFKPTWGRISRFGLFPFAPSMDHVAYFTRDVKDSAILLSILAGRDDKDSTSSTKPVDIYENKIVSSLINKKLVVIKEIYDSIPEGKIRTTFDKLVKDLSNKGATISTVSMDINLCKAIYPTYVVISCSEATSNNANLDGIKFGKRKSGESFEEVMTNARTHGFSELIKRRFIIGSYSLLKENQHDVFLRAQKCRRLIVNAVNKILKDADAIMLPAAPTTAPLFNGASADKLSDEYLIADNFMAIGNFGGLPSITIPMGFENNLPFGLNITSKAFDEVNLFSVSSAIEETTGIKCVVAKGE